MAIFLDSLTGLGLLYELDSYRDADEDTPSDEEVRRAAGLLHRPWLDGPESLAVHDEEEAWEELQGARRVRQRVFGEWCGALASMHRTHQHLELFPWLRPWAEAAIQLKADRLRTLQAQTRLLVTEDALLTAAAAAAQQEPHVPVNEPVFAPLGAPAQANKQMRSLWQRWQRAVGSSWDHPREQTYLVHHLADGMGSRRKGRDQLLEHARAMLTEWETAARSAAAGQHNARILVTHLPRDPAAEHDALKSLLSQLDEWELGVLASYTVDTAWHPQSVITVQVPEPVAARLLAQRHGLSYSEPKATGTEPTTAEPPADHRPRGESPFGPGVFDDTPVHSRRLVSHEHLRMLRAVARDAEQLYVVLSLEAGLEIVALSVLEQRCTAGWQGVLVAGANDLPEALFEAHLSTPGPVLSESEEIWPARIHDPHHEAFGHRLGIEEGERLMMRLCSGRRDAGHALRSLALARGVADLRELEGVGFDDRGFARRPFAYEVWHGLLAMEQLDLEPFVPDTDTAWRRGSGLPLGVLAKLQAYTSDAAGRYQGRAHSPGCAHRRPEHGVSRDDDLVTVEELMGSEGFDPCSKCGGYAVRRLGRDQVAYYRAAHRLHDLVQKVRTAACRGRDVAELAATLQKFASLDRKTTEAWFPSREEVRRWQRIVEGLRHELPPLPGPV
ncbi:hypothetical protein ACN6K9_002539 [Streptomyces sp. SAS_267]|uniref:hypothetical protein n=1 Tax=unclassified Streptomyces TaxID=2593676 RepID=UPI0036FE4CC1